NDDDVFDAVQEILRLRDQDFNTDGLVDKELLSMLPKVVDASSVGAGSEEDPEIADARNNHGQGSCSGDTNLQAVELLQAFTDTPERAADRYSHRVGLSRN